jgi:hypothetical protein
MYEDLQRAVRERMVTDALLVALLGGPKVYDSIAPPGVVLPYIVVKGWNTIDASLLIRTARDTTFEVHAWSDYKGIKVIAQINKKVVDLFDHHVIEASEWVVPLVKLDFDQLLFEEETGLQHSVSRFRLLVERRVSQ